jgi:hypothetical protein
MAQDIARWKNQDIVCTMYNMSGAHETSIQ